jgi:3-oxoacyl-[acyl-carrier protein] reductase
MNRVALITGAAQGIGRAIAERLAADGTEVIVADVDYDMAQRTAESMRHAGARATALALDVSDETSVSAAYGDIERRFAGLHILVNNAGVPGTQDGRREPIEKTTLATWERTLAINLTGAMLMCRGAIPLMRRAGFGRIVNISSRAARTRSVPHVGCYSTSKAAMIGLSQVLAGELGPEGFTVNCVAPSTVRTALTLSTTVGQSGYFERASDNTAVGRLGTAADIADAVAFLCSDDAAFITGTVLDVNGGSAMI